MKGSLGNEVAVGIARRMVDRNALDIDQMNLFVTELSKEITALKITGDYKTDLAFVLDMIESKAVTYLNDTLFPAAARHLSAGNKVEGRLVKSAEIVTACETITKDIYNSISDQYKLIALRYFNDDTAFLEYILDQLHVLIEKAVLEYNTRIMSARSRE